MWDGASDVISQWRAIVICSFICMGALQYGYDSSYFSGILVMNPFLENYGTYDSATGTHVLSASKQSLATSIINVGELIGAMSSYLIGDRFGRRGGLYVSSFFVIAGTVLQAVPTTFGTLIAGRILVGFAVGIISCLVPLYVADSSPAKLRGSLVAMYQFVIGVGLLLGAIITAVTEKRNDSSAYRIPMAIQCLFPMLLLPGLFTFVPESPRWLMEKGHEIEASLALRRLLGDKTEVIAAEFAAIRTSNSSILDQGSSSWFQVFKWGPEGRKAYLGVTLQAFQQASGVTFVTSYGVSFFTNLGINDAFLIQLGLYLVGWPSLWLSQYFLERAGRRTVLIVSGLGMTSSLLIRGAVGVSRNESPSADRTIVAMVYIFLFIFNLGWGPVVWVVTSEISTGRNRGRLMSLSTGSNWFFAWLVSFTFPYMYNQDARDLGPSMGFLYGAFMILACGWVYLFLPETAGKSLEEIHALFERGMPARMFNGGFLETTIIMQY